MLGRRLGMKSSICSPFPSVSTPCFITGEESRGGVPLVKHHHNRGNKSNNKGNAGSEGRRGSHGDPTIPIAVDILIKTRLLARPVVQAPGQDQPSARRSSRRRLPLSSPPACSAPIVLSDPGWGSRPEAGPPPVQQSPIPTAVAPLTLSVPGGGGREIRATSTPLSRD